jgi:hypothetical protein
VDDGGVGVAGGGGRVAAGGRGRRWRGRGRRGGGRAAAAGDFGSLAALTPSPRDDLRGEGGVTVIGEGTFGPGSSHAPGPKGYFRRVCSAARVKLPLVPVGIFKLFRFPPYFKSKYNIWHIKMFRKEISM